MTHVHVWQEIPFGKKCQDCGEQEIADKPTVNLNPMFAGDISPMYRSRPAARYVQPGVEREEQILSTATVDEGRKKMEQALAGTALGIPDRK